MNTCWVLTIQTSLPHTCENRGDLHTECCVFDAFPKAKTALRERLKALAFSHNSMFDGMGKMKHFDRYVADSYEWAEQDEDEEFLDNGWLTVGRMTTLQEALTKVFSGEDLQPPLPESTYEDGMLALEVRADSVKLVGWDDGPCNGYEPLIATNMFNMVQEGDYYLYLDDLFGQDDCSAELYIDLKKATIA